MMNANLQKAIDTFRIHDVYLRNSVAQCVNGFEPKYASDIDKLEMQTKHVVRETQIAQLDETQWLVRVYGMTRFPVILHTASILKSSPEGEGFSPNPRVGQ